MFCDLFSNLLFIPALVHNNKALKQQCYTQSYVHPNQDRASLSQTAQSC